ncbi:MAG: DUF2961 domain-containing protein, partial [bacterium]
PMPFWESARLDLYNSSISSPVTVQYVITYKNSPYPEACGYFHATEQSFQASMNDEDLPLGEIVGHGNVVGVAVTLVADDSQSYLHGDLRVYRDGINEPAIQGTDFDGDFNAGNYFTTGAFTRPVHGAPVIHSGVSDEVCVYRFLLGDLIPFGNRIQLRAEHGNRNKTPIEFSSVVYSFHKPEIALVQTDALDIGNQEDEVAHSYLVQGGQTTQNHYYAYPGSYDDQFFSDQGKVHFGISSFNATIDAQNTGVRLVRRRDAAIFPQQAQVNVNGDSIGVWWDGSANNYKRWSDSAFEIPASFTAGFSEIQISIQALGTSSWSEYVYWIYSHVPPRQDVFMPTQVNNLTIQTMEAGSQLFLEWEEAWDENGVSHYRIYRSASPGVQQTSAFLIGETPLLNYTDQNLTPGMGYYYRVSAVDFSNNEGNASAEAMQTTSCNYLYEAENWIVLAASSGDPSEIQNMTYYGENWSNQEQLFYHSNSIGDFFTVIISVSTADTFDVAAYFTKTPSYGSVVLRIDDQAMASSVDLYAPYVQRSPKIDFGSVYLTTGEHDFKFEVIGKNGASTNYQIGVDNLLLTPHQLLPVMPGSSLLPAVFDLRPGYPNPFNSQARITFSLQFSAWATLTIYDLLGRQVAVLQNGWLSSGIHTKLWRAGDLPSGIYFLKLEQRQLTKIQKM